MVIARLIAQGDHILLNARIDNCHLAALIRGTKSYPSADDIVRIETALPLGSAQGDRSGTQHREGPERYC